MRSQLKAMLAWLLLLLLLLQRQRQPRQLQGCP
jgi:hypothetical protein